MYTRLVTSLGIALLLLPVFASAATCPKLTRNLSFGSRGADVTALQNFLIAEGDLAVGNNTGYFGRLTEAAVKKWQSRNGVVSSGTPRTTGYGAVGPRTRAAIARVCGSRGSTQSTSPTTPPATAPIPSALQPNCPLVALPIGQPCSGSWKEVKDTKGCTASWTCQ